MVYTQITILNKENLSIGDIEFVNNSKFDEGFIGILTGDETNPVDIQFQVYSFPYLLEVIKPGDRIIVPAGYHWHLDNTFASVYTPSKNQIAFEKLYTYKLVTLDSNGDYVRESRDLPVPIKCVGNNRVNMYKLKSHVRHITKTDLTLILCDSGYPTLVF